MHLTILGHKRRQLCREPLGGPITLRELRRAVIAHKPGAPVGANTGPHVVAALVRVVADAAVRQAKQA